MVRVLVVDDSEAARDLVSGILRTDPGIHVIGSAVDGHDALEAVERLHPDVVTMDLVMPRLGGIEAIRRIMAERPTPIVVVATPQSNEKWVFQAMEAGALTVLEKPPGPGSPRFDAEASRLIAAVKLTAGVRVTGRRPRRKAHADAVPARPRRRPSDGRAEIVAVVASTGGPPALASVLRELGGLRVPLLVVQHIAEGFENGLARWLDDIGPLRVRIAGGGQKLRAGEALIAPAGSHLGVSRRGTTVLSSSAALDGFRPSATFLFRSVAEVHGRRALAVVLTGMGRDGIDGLVALKSAGGSVIAQDAKTSAVYGMPAAAVAAGVVDEVLPLGDIAGAIAEHCVAVQP